MLKKALLLSFFLLPFFIQPAHAQTPPEQNYYRAEVTRVAKEGMRDINSFTNFFQLVEIKLTEGPEKDKKVTIEHGGSIKVAEQKKVKPGDQIIVLVLEDSGGRKTYSIWDKYRLDYVYYLIIGFFALVIIFAGLKGVGSLVGMGISLLVLLFFIVPQILAGRDPLLVSVGGSIVIFLTTIFLAHGISKRTGVAALSTFISLVITGLLAFAFVKGIHLSGLGDENSYMLQIGPAEINPQGLLLGGIIIGALGVLDDITTTQAASVFELAKLNSKLSVADLFRKGYSIGKEHIVSLVNTLVLAYAGAALSLFVIFVLNPTNSPTWVILNNEMVVEEIVRTIAGSIGLILAVPITTLIASYIAVKKTT